jgi:hypothetical protein
MDLNENGHEFDNTTFVSISELLSYHQLIKILIEETSIFVMFYCRSFIPKEHDIYCAKCYEDKFATKCIKCNKVTFFAKFRSKLLFKVTVEAF